MRRGEKVKKKRRGISFLIPVFRSFSTSEQGQGLASYFLVSLCFPVLSGVPLMPGSQNPVFKLGWIEVSREEIRMAILFNTQLVLLKHTLSPWIIFF